MSINFWPCRHWRTMRSAVFAALLACASPGGLADDVGPVTVPMAIHGEHLFLQASINDSPVTLVLDTGAGGNVITPQAAAHLRLTPGSDRTSVAGAGGDVSSIPSVTVDRLGLGEAHLEKQVAYLVPLPETAKSDGLLGTPFLQNWVVTIDYSHALLTLTPDASFSPPAGVSAFPLRFHHNVPEIEATADGCKGWFQIDTGANDAITLFDPFVEANHMRGRYVPWIQAVTGHGIGGLTYGDWVRLPQFTIGPFRFTLPVAELSRQTQGVFTDKETAGSLGGEVWDRFTLTLDYAGKKAYLVPNAQFDRPFVGPRSGLGVELVKGVYTVRSVIAASPGGEAGIKTGDTLLSLDDRPAEQMQPWEVTDLLRRDAGTRVRMRMRSADGTVREVTLTLRDLI